MYKSILLDIELCRLLFPLDGFSEDEPLLVELFDQDFRAKEFLGQVDRWRVAHSSPVTVHASSATAHAQLPPRCHHCEMTDFAGQQTVFQSCQVLPRDQQDVS